MQRVKIPKDKLRPFMKVHCSWERICRRLGVETESYTLREHVEGHDGWDYKNRFEDVNRDDLNETNKRTV